MFSLGMALNQGYGRLMDCIGARVVILGHHNADPDVIGAAQGIRELVTTLRPESSVQVFLPDDVSSLSKSLAASLGVEIEEKVTLSDPDTFIVVDTGSLSQLGPYEKVIKETRGKVVFIDHHLQRPELREVCLSILEPEASSTSEIVYWILRHHDIKPSHVTASALLSGMAFDSKHFSIGGPSLFRAASELLEIVGDVAHVKERLVQPMSYSEKVARLKASQRAEIVSIGEWVAAFSVLGSFQSSGARAMVSLGADVAAVVGEDKGELRVSLRSTNELRNRTGFHLGDLAAQLGAEFDGSGSGHPTAAGVNCRGSLDSFRVRFFELVTEAIRA
ncbi:MAG: DHH family phosphoesterase [Candidatus Bathyarchaeota archaeon]